MIFFDVFFCMGFVLMEGQKSVLFWGIFWCNFNFLNISL